MSNVLIPFAIHIQTQEVVSISDVDSGLACNCRCPSCGARLIAKKNSPSRVDHFAHHDGSATVCELSFETSVRLMLMQSMSQIKQITLPRFLHDTPEGKILAGKGGVFLVEDCIARDTPNEPQLMISIPNSDKKIALYVPPVKEQFAPLWISSYAKSNPNTGVLLVNITSLGSLLLNQLKGRGSVSPKTILMDIVSTDSDYLSWIFHPRQQSLSKLTASTYRQSNNAPSHKPALARFEVKTTDEVEHLFCKHCFMRSEALDEQGMCYRKSCVSSRSLTITHGADSQMGNNENSATQVLNMRSKSNDLAPGREALAGQLKSIGNATGDLKKGMPCPRCRKKLIQVGKIIICNHCGFKKT